ncbi:hypothetical protein MKW92_040423 [Papaver armeniacum]|nr:hypothetical protein MKW92_040423 [Papaver armeniacum]
MGSEVPPAAVTIHVTGFKRFHGVSENPTETIVCNLEQYLKRKGSPKGFILGSCDLLKSLDSESSNIGKTIWLHFGVNSGATKFAIENQAVNEAMFPCPDEMGWKPQNVPIVPTDGDTSRTRETALPVDEIIAALTKMGYGVTKSNDAGRFVCNYVYYHSLRFAEENKIKSLFVHVPPFITIDEETQMQFTASLLEVLASLC